MISKLARWVASLGGMAALLSVGMASAQTAPESFQIDEWSAHSGVIIAGDLLVLAHYDVNFADDDLPDAPLSDLAAIFVSDEADAIVGAMSPSAYTRLGYGHGLASLYIPAADASSALSQRLTLRLAVLPPPTDLSADDFVTSGKRAVAVTNDSLEQEVKQRLLDIGLNPEWQDLPLVNTTTGTLTQAGQEYLSMVMPGFHTYLPNLLGSGVAVPRHAEADYDNEAWDTGTLWQDTQLGEAISSLQDSTKVPGVMIAGLIVMAICLAVSVWAVRATGSTLVTLPIMGLVVSATALSGLIPIGMPLFLGFASMLVIVFILFLRRHPG